MSKLLSGSLLRGAIALLVASALWMFVSFTENPQQSTPLTNLPISAEGLAPGTTLVDDSGVPIRAPDAVVNLTVVGPRSALENVSKQTIQPYINLGGLPAGTHSVKVEARTIPASDAIEFLSIQPGRITVTVEELITATVPLTVTTDGQPPTSYEAGLPHVTAGGADLATIQVSGPASQVRKVANGAIVLDLSSQTTSLSTRRQVIPVDQDGREVEGVTVAPGDADVEVKISSSSGIKRVPIIYNVRDNAPAGFRPEITLRPAFVSLIGSSQALARVDFIETDPIDVSGEVREFQVEVSLRFPPGVTPRDADAAETTVASVRIVPIETQFALSLPVVPRNALANTSVTIEPASVEVQVRGAVAINRSNLALLVDLSGLAPGVYELAPSLELPDGLTLVSDLPAVKVTLRSTLPPTPTPLPAPLTPTLPPPTATLSPTVETPDPTAEPTATQGPALPTVTP
jgi:YbbR domain-containing protein